MKALIIEDEELVADELESKISDVATDVEILKRITSLKAAIQWFKQNKEPDVVFMDIQLGDGVTFEIFEHVQINCPIIFTTAYDEYAIRAFKVNGIDYLLKPVDKDELKNAIDKCRAAIGRKAFPGDLQQLLETFANPSGVKNDYKKKFIINVRDQLVPVLTEEIACFVKDTIQYLYTFKGDRFVVEYASIEEIEELLDPKKFFRANRQCIVNMDCIQNVRLQENYKLTLHLKAPVKVLIDISREKAPAFKKWFEG
jgi:DNA-binding LytR/AlgR family response regulator